jgi:hypothetical protein
VDRRIGMQESPNVKFFYIKFISDVENLSARVISLSEELLQKTKMIMAIRGYETQKKKKWSKGIDFIVIEEVTKNKILMRIIEDVRSKSGIIGLDMIKKLVEKIDQDKYDEIIFIGKSFTSAATNELEQRNIEFASENLMPFHKKDKIYHAIQNRIDELCEAKCGQIPETESDCKGYSQEDSEYQCNIRRISDDAFFHLKRGWGHLLSNDLLQLVSIDFSEE